MKSTGPRRRAVACRDEGLRERMYREHSGAGAAGRTSGGKEGGGGLHTEK